MKVYACITFHQKIKIVSFETLEKERKALVEQYLNDNDIFEDFLDNFYCATDFYKKEPNEKEIMEHFKQYCENCAKQDTFGQYEEIEIE